MPSTSPAQHRLMEGIAHGSIPAGGKHPPLSVAKEFAAADEAKAHKRKKTLHAMYPSARNNEGT